MSIAQPSIFHPKQFCIIITLYALSANARQQQVSTRIWHLLGLIVIKSDSR